MGEFSTSNIGSVERAQKKWDDAHSKTNYKMRFAMSHPVVGKFRNFNYLGGQVPLTILKSYLDAPVDRALELACGRGDLAVSMVENGFSNHLYAYDVSDAAIKDAQKKSRN